MEVGTIQVTKAIADITAQLEYYRLRLIEANEKDKVQKLKILTEEEKQQATHFLQQSGLLQRTNELIGQSGVTGEHRISR